MADDGYLQQIQQLILQITHNVDNNQLLKQSEETLVSIRSSSPEIYLTRLTSLISSGSSFPVKQFSAVMLRQALLSKDDYWKPLAEPSKQMIKSSLLQLLTQLTAPSPNMNAQVQRECRLLNSSIVHILGPMSAFQFEESLCGFLVRLFFSILTTLLPPDRHRSTTIPVA